MSVEILKAKKTDHALEMLVKGSGYCGILVKGSDWLCKVVELSMHLRHIKLFKDL